MQGRLLSSFEPTHVVSSGLPPRVLDTSGLQGFKQVDFVGYATNPHARRSLPPGEASKRVAATRNLRQSSKSDEDQKCGHNQRTPNPRPLTLNPKLPCSGGSLRVSGGLQAVTQPWAGAKASFVSEFSYGCLIRSMMASTRICK